MEKPQVHSSLYQSSYEHDACGVGYIANINGKKSHAIVANAIRGLKNLAHRGAVDADKITGDGAGILTAIPYKIFRDYLESKGKKLFRDEDLGVGVVFLSKDDEYAQTYGKKIIEKSIEKAGLTLLAWREVPVNPECLAKKAEHSRPIIKQVLVAKTEDLSIEEYRKTLYLVLKRAEKEALAESVKDFYMVSFSNTTITYKGLLNAPQVKQFFPDLTNPDYESSFALFHQRFATNTFPDWTKAQPYRMMAHNGEINTIRGNRLQMKAREYSKLPGVWGDSYDDLIPFLETDQSDSASFDNCLQMLTIGGRDLAQNISFMMPFAWENDVNVSDSVRSYYRHHACLMEPWDGPAAIVASDGRYIVASLDRNGLRPARYKIHEDGTIVLASEVGLIPVESPVVEAGRLGPGRLLVLDMQENRLYRDDEMKRLLADKTNYSAWCEETLITLKSLVKDFSAVEVPDEATLLANRKTFNYDADEEKIILLPMAIDGKEAVGSMGDDTPMAVLSRRPRLLYSYFKQLFAQVTNPAIDPIREKMVMSLNMIIGGRLNLFQDISDLNQKTLIELGSPLLLPSDFSTILGHPDFANEISTLSAVFPVAGGKDALEPALRKLAAQAVEASKAGARIIVLSDRATNQDNAPIPMLLAVGAVQQALITAGQRRNTDIICETAEARDTHQIACLLGYGANAIYPYMALELLTKAQSTGDLGEEISLETAYENYRTSIDNGLLKIFAKMGISTLMSYQGCQLFEAIGVSNQVVDDCFLGTSCPISGIGYPQIADETLARHTYAYGPAGEEEEEGIWEEGYYKQNKRGTGEVHGWSPKVVSGMNRFIRKGGDFENWSAFKEASDDHAPIAFKDLLKFRFADKEIPLEEVEPIEDIRARFTTAAMSLGAISPEAHECLAIAMNAIGGKSNSGEGGEDPRRFEKFENGDDANSAIKQVASGRFGVSAEYLSNAKEIEIKVSQGAKPGEGGQLPGHKVTPLIARLRFSVPGVTLISPPPHHDIYSIEDLAQLIFDLKEVNPRAKVCVKLVSSSGVGTIAAGVAKAYADVILISGHDGGTGASPISSIKNAGSAWELGISEVHQTLMINNLRDHVTLRTDGGMKTGSDIVKAAILGAEQYNFGTAALIAAGCAMFRVCHLNTCPVGVATQREDLRQKFKGKPENVINYFNAIAEDVRRILAKLGFRKLDDIVGRTELLEQIADEENPKTKTINFSRLLHNVDPSGNQDRIHTREVNDSPGHEIALDHRILQEAKHTLVHKKPVFKGSYKVTNLNRDIGTRIAGQIAYHHGNKGMPPATLDLTFKGSAGQSFGTFAVQGMRLTLEGEANDYVGKGMNGGELIVKPSAAANFVWSENILLGNTCLYGATGGYLFAAGRAGERFAVRNSGATAVVEGLGDHGCEYMNAGNIIVLGETGRNFGSGMSGGVAFILDELDNFESLYNPDMVGIERLDHSEEIESLKTIIEAHYKFTQSPRAEEILMNWNETLNKFWKVVPHKTSDDVPTPRFILEDKSLLAAS